MLSRKAAAEICVVALPGLSRFMNPKIICLLTAASLTLNGALFAAGGKTYEITGTVPTVTGSTPEVRMGMERYEFAIGRLSMKGSAERTVSSTGTGSYGVSATGLIAA